MKINPIISPSNSLIKTIRGLHQRSQREKTGLFLIEGPHPVAEAFASPLKITSVVVSQSFLKDGLPDFKDIDLSAVSVVEDKLFRQLVTTTSACGILALAEIPSWTLDDLLANAAPIILVADAIQDPGNLGTMMRTALAAGVDGMILTTGTVDPFNPKVVRSAMGAIFSLPILSDIPRKEAWRSLQERGIKVVACDPEAGLPYFDADLTGPLALVLGNEGQGFDKEVLPEADLVISIPMSNKSESLNVAVSAGIILFAAASQRMKR